MSLLEQASLVVTPNGYKAGTLFSVVPNAPIGDLTVVRATTATRVNSDGLIELVSSNVPRLNYPLIDGVVNGCPSLLLEPQRTNLALYSEQINNTGFWALTNSGTITANSTISPDGYQNADTLNAGAASSQVQGAIVGTSGAVYTVSIWVKRITGTGNVFLRAVENTNTLIAVTSDWQRFTATVTSTTTTIRIGINLATSGDAVAVWGGQIEAGAYATSYIGPTLGASVTRGADAVSKTGISSLIGQTEGVIFIDFEIQTSGQDMAVMNIYNGTTPANSMYFYLNSSNVLVGYVDNSGTQVTISTGVLAQGRYKAALAYKSNDFAFYLNGSLIGVDVSGTVPTCNALRLENYAPSPTYQEKIAVNQAILFKTRLSNAELATLTTL
jgi:hypothetical protein